MLAAACRCVVCRNPSWFLVVVLLLLPPGFLGVAHLFLLLPAVLGGVSTWCCNTLKHPATQKLLYVASKIGENLKNLCSRVATRLRPVTWVTSQIAGREACRNTNQRVLEETAPCGASHRGCHRGGEGLHTGCGCCPRPCAPCRPLPPSLSSCQAAIPCADPAAMSSCAVPSTTA